MFDNLAKTIIKHPKAIIAAWIVVLLIALPVGIHYEDKMTYDLTSMVGNDSESSQGMELISNDFYQTVSTTTIVVVPYDTKEQLDIITGNFMTSLNSGLNEKYNNGTYALGAGSYTNKEQDPQNIYMIAIQYGGDLTGTDEIGNIRDIVNDAKATSGLDLKTYVTGNDAITYDTETEAAKDVSMIDPFSILLILILLGLFFWTITTAIVPPATVGMAYGIVLALIFLLGSIMDIFYITSIIVLVSMLGAGCDYAIFIVSRYREERKADKDKDAALTEAIKWAGESVATSGLAVIIGFGVMSLCSFSMIRTMGIVLALGIVVAMFAALTFIPSILALTGDKIFWPNKIDSYKQGGKARNGFYGKLANLSKRYFTRVSKISKKYAAPIVAAAILLTVPMAYLAFTSETSYDMISTMPTSEGKEGIYTITDYTDGGNIMPTYVVIELEDSIATVTSIPNSQLGFVTWHSNYMQDVQMTNTMSESIIANDPNGNVSYILAVTPWNVVYQTVAAKIGTTDPTIVNPIATSMLPEAIQPSINAVFANLGNVTPDTPVLGGMTTISGVLDYVINYCGGTISSDGMYLKMMVVFADEPMSDISMDSIDALRSIVHDEFDITYGSIIAQTWVAGSVVSLNEIASTVSSEFNLIEVGVVLLIYVLLFFVLGSYLTPVRSLFTILMGITWILALTHLVFTGLLNTPVTWVMPIVLLVVCLGLGMDYDILMTTRIKENKHKGMSNDDAIDEALIKSGSIITLCGLIMGGTFLTLLISSSPMLQEFGFALGFAILIDALIIIPYIVTAFMHLMGDWSWKGPKFLQKMHGNGKTE